MDLGMRATSGFTERYWVPGGFSGFPSQMPLQQASPWLSEMPDHVLLMDGHHPPRLTLFQGAQSRYFVPHSFNNSVCHEASSGIFRAKDQIMPLTYLIHSRVSCHI